MGILVRDSEATRVCVSCAQPIGPDGPIAFDLVDRYHAACWARAAQVRAFDRRGQAQETRDRAERAASRATLVRGQSTPVVQCPVCCQGLAHGAAVLFQGTQLVHAACWRMPGADRRPRAAS